MLPMALQQQATESTSPVRVSTLELFFDLVFVFAITQLTSVLARELSFATAGRVLLMFGLLWWMYGGYAWLTNTRTLSDSTERLLLLIGMAGFLVIGLSMPEAFGTGSARSRDGVALGIAYLVVVLVHGVLYRRVNRNIQRVLPFNVASAVLVIIAGLTYAPAEYWLWGLALALQVLTPIIVRVGGRFDIAPSHFVERHGALIIVAFGESVVDVGIGAAGHRVTPGLALAATLGLALTAAFWWVFFGTGDDDRAEEAMTAADPALRPGLALTAYFYPFIPMLLGIVAVAAALRRAVSHPDADLSAGLGLALAGGVALFLAGDALFRRALRIGTPWYRVAAAALALACWPVAVEVGAEAAIALLTGVIAGALVSEQATVRGISEPQIEGSGKTDKRASVSGERKDQE